MDTTTENKNSRINLRLKSSAKSLLERAARFVRASDRSLQEVRRAATTLQ